MDIIKNDSTIQFLMAGMDAASQRHRVISANIANVDTPGYKAQDINFEDVMKNFLEEETFSIESDPENVRLQVTENLEPRPVPFLTERFDGNNVDIDREMATLTAARGRYMLAKELLATRIRLIHENLRA